MESKLPAENFSQIFFDSLPQIIVDLPNKAFNYCVKDFKKPFLTETERICLQQFSQKYLFSVDHTLINFSKKVLE
jgi:hypothetical protein